MALVAAGTSFPNSRSPLPPSYWAASGDDLYSTFAAGLTSKGASMCAPSPASFVQVDPAGSLYPVVSPGTSPALSSAVLAPSAVSPLAARVYQTEQSMYQMLTSRPNALSVVVDAVGQQGASSSAGGDFAQLVPMTTSGMIAERTGRRSAGDSRRSYSLRQNTDTPGVPWGVAPVEAPGGGCGGRSGLKAALWIGAAFLLGWALVNE